MAQVTPEQDPAAESEVTPEILEIARRVYDELRYYVPIATGMVDQVRRNGLLTKKTIDGDHHIKMEGSKNYYRDTRSTTPDGGLIIHRDDTHLHLGSCKTFAHPPYESSREYRGEKGRDYYARLNLAELAVGASDCGFCSILYQGIQLNRKFWISKWSRVKWIDSHPQCDIREAHAMQPWVEEEEYQPYFEGEKSVNEAEVYLHIEFPKGHPYVDVHMNMDPFHFAKAGARRLPILHLEYYTAPRAPSPWAAFGSAPHIDSSILNDGILGQILGWMNDCEATHLACTQQVDPGVPSRLLRLTWPTDMANTGESPHVCLEVTDPSINYQYVALSHVWAETKPLMTVQSSVQEYSNRVPWDRLSLAIREAVVLTCALGFEYLWIDSLCIIQKDKKDWENELTRMGMIYGNAAVVFAAHGPDLGLEKAPQLPIQDPSRPGDNAVYCRQKIDHMSMFSAPKTTDSWFGRAWCMQERILARRILHFGGFCEELCFECNTSIECECSRVRETRTAEELDGRTLKAKVTSALALMNDRLDPVEANHELWRTYVTFCEDYSARGITYATDTLPAISALMGSLAPYFGNYYAGLWQSHLLLCLQWEALDTSECCRHKSYVAPSFSWASRYGAVIWYMDTSSIPTEDSHEFATVIDVACALTGKDPFGGVSGGHLTLRGRTTEMSIASKDLFGPDGRLKMIKEGAKACYVTLDSMDDIQGVNPGMMVTCLDVMRDKNGSYSYVSSLVILPVDPLGKKFRRIGFSTMLVEHFNGASQEEITIV